MVLACITSLFTQNIQKLSDTGTLQMFRYRAILEHTGILDLRYYFSLDKYGRTHFLIFVEKQGETTKFRRWLQVTRIITGHVRYSTLICHHSCFFVSAKGEMNEPTKAERVMIKRKYVKSAWHISRPHGHQGSLRTYCFRIVQKKTR